MIGKIDVFFDIHFDVVKLWNIGLMDGQ